LLLASALRIIVGTFSSHLDIQNTTIVDGVQRAAINRKNPHAVLAAVREVHFEMRVVR